MLRKLLIILMIILIPTLGVLYYADQRGVSLEELFNPTSTLLTIGDARLNVEVVETPEDRRRGLSGKEDLAPLQGMLFVFPETGHPGIWMKDMLFPIDLVWISEDLEVAEITTNVTPESYPKVFEPSVPVKYVLETGLYFSESFGIKVGDKVVLPVGFERHSNPE